MALIDFIHSWVHLIMDAHLAHVLVNLLVLHPGDLVALDSLPQILVSLDVLGASLPSVRKQKRQETLSVRGQNRPGETSRKMESLAIAILRMMPVHQKQHPNPPSSLPYPLT